MLRSFSAAGVFVLLSSSPALAESLRLSQLIDAAQRENPDLKVLSAKLEALVAQRSGAGQLPAPMVAISSMGESDPFSMREKPSYEVSQTLPFPTKILASKRAASLTLTAGKAATEYDTRVIVSSVRAAFWDYFRAYNEKQLKEEQLQVLKDHLRRIARSPVSDTLTNSHILGIQNEISAMDSELDEASFQIRRVRNVLAVYTGLSTETLMRAPENLPLSDLPAISIQAADNPLLEKARTEVERARADLSLAQNAYLPDFTLTYKWNSSFGPMPRSQEIMLGMSLPFVFFWQPAAEAREAKARLIESEAMEEKARRESLAALSNLSEELAVLARKFQRLEKESIPRSEKRMALAHSISFSDMQSLDQHREILEDLLKLKLERLQVRADYEKKLAELQVLRGDL